MWEKTCVDFIGAYPSYRISVQVAPKTCWGAFGVKQPMDLPSKILGSQSLCSANANWETKRCQTLAPTWKTLRWLEANHLILAVHCDFGWPNFGTVFSFLVYCMFFFLATLWKHDLPGKRAWGRRLLVFCWYVGLWCQSKEVIRQQLVHHVMLLKNTVRF